MNAAMEVSVSPPESLLKYQAPLFVGIEPSAETINQAKGAKAGGASSGGAAAARPKPAKPAAAASAAAVAAVTAGVARLPAAVSASAGRAGADDEKQAQEADVIIIGAGVAGMECAQVLARAGVSSILLEARDRFGGRINTDHTTFGYPMECGAHWIHGATKKNPLKQYADALGIRRVVTLDEETLVNERGQEFESDDEDELEGMMEKLTDGVFKLKKELKGVDIPLDQAFTRTIDKMGLAPNKRERLFKYAHNQVQYSLL